jgi:hypothetical protein
MKRNTAQRSENGTPTSATAIVREHVAASKRFRRSIRGNAAKSKAFLVRAGILNKSGTKLAKQYR